MTPFSSYAVERDGDRNILVFSGSQAVPVLDPHTRYDWSTRMIQQSVYDGLLKYVGDPAKIVPWLAEKYEASADGKTYTFTLVSNAKFHNGDPVDAEAVRFSFERALKLNTGISWMLKDVLKPAGITVVDARTVRFTLDKPYAPFISYVPWWFIVNPRQVMANQVDGDLGQKWMAENDAGSGPFKLRRFSGTTLIHMDTVADYWKGWPMGEKQRLSGVIYRIIREAAPRKSAFQRKEVDVIANVTPDDYAQLERVPGVKMARYPGFTTFGIKLNCKAGPTADINLRKAIAYSFDYDSLLTVLNGMGDLMTSPFPPATIGHIEVPDMPRRNLDKAREFLKKSAYPNGGIELEYCYNNVVEDARRIGLSMLASLRALDIKVNVVAQPWPTMLARAAKPETSPAMFSVYATPASTDPDSVAYWYHQASWGLFYGPNFYENPRVWKLIDDARSEMDTKRRMEMYAEIQRDIVADQPEIFCMMANRIWGLRDYVKGMDYSPVRATHEVDFYPMWVAA